MRIQIGRGLWRLWLVASVIWVGGFSIYFYSAYQRLAPKTIQHGTLTFDDLIPSYKPCWDYRTEDGRNIDIKQLSDSALVKVYACQLKVDQTDLLKTAVLTIVAIPLAVLLLGWALLWAGRGFVYQKSDT